MALRVNPTAIPGVLLLELPRFADERGFFMEAYRDEWAELLSLGHGFIQDNYSRSRKGVLRGLHYQIERPQAKLVMALSGRVQDVVVDIRVGSETFGQHISVELSEERPTCLYVPVGCAHGFAVLSEHALVYYKCSDTYWPSGERGLRWSDPALGIAWAVDEPQTNARDEALPCLADIPPGDLPSLGGGA